jgi:hypothetical protein
MPLCNTFINDNQALFLDGEYFGNISQFLNNGCEHAHQDKQPNYAILSGKFHSALFKSYVSWHWTILTKFKLILKYVYMWLSLLVTTLK